MENNIKSIEMKPSFVRHTVRANYIKSHKYEEFLRRLPKLEANSTKGQEFCRHRSVYRTNKSSNFDLLNRVMDDIQDYYCIVKFW
jgi:hypothetical protein